MGEVQGPHLHQHDLWVDDLGDTGEWERGAHRDPDAVLKFFLSSKNSLDLLSASQKWKTGATLVGLGLAEK